MELREFEQQARKKLTERGITSSPESWEKLKMKLPEEVPSPSRGSLWYGITAEGVLAIIAGTCSWTLLKGPGK